VPKFISTAALPMSFVASPTNSREITDYWHTFLLPLIAVRAWRTTAAAALCLCERPGIGTPVGSS